MRIVSDRPRPPLARLVVLLAIGGALLAPVGSGLARAAARGAQPAGGPSARYGGAMGFDFAAHQLILFGGTSSSGALADTWSWSGSAWTLLHPATSPPALSDASIAYDPGRSLLVLFGGHDSGGARMNQTWTWDGSNWTKKSPSKSPRPGTAPAWPTTTA